MVKETEYYDLLGVSVTATDADIKRGYRKMAIKTHPDKNPDDPKAAEKFQAVSEAYQVLGNKELRERYDKFGKEEAKPSEGFDDPVAFASSVFGGGAFESYIGEIALIKQLFEINEMDVDVSKQEEKLASERQEQQTQSESGASESTQAEQPHHRLHHLSLHPHKSSEAPASSAHAETETEKNSAGTGLGASAPSHASSYQDLKAQKEAERALKQKRKEALHKIDEENRIAREKRIETLAKELVQKLGVYTEAPSMDAEFKQNYTLKLEAEAAQLKMESFGLLLLHTIGNIYYTRASLFLKSRKAFGLVGMYGKIKDVGSQVKDLYSAITAATEAYQYIQTATEIEEDGKMSAEEQQDLEQKKVGKIFTTLWIGTKIETQSVLRAVCDKVLHDKTVDHAYRVKQAEALKIMGDIFRNTQRTEAEKEEMQFFESLVAESSTNKAKTLRKSYAKVPPKKA